MKRHGWFVLVRGLEAKPDDWECAYTVMFESKREAQRMLREYRRDYGGDRLEFYLAKATVVPAAGEAEKR